jgi:hypothetical protein
MKALVIPRVMIGLQTLFLGLAVASSSVDVIIPGHGAAWHDKDFVNLEAELFETIISQVGQAVQQGAVTVEEMQKAVNVEPFRLRFTHDDKHLNKQFRSSAKDMVENAYRKARDGKTFQ